MGKLFFAIIITVAILLAIITFANQPKQQSSYSNPFASSSPEPTSATEAQASPTPPLVTAGVAEPIPASISAIIKTSKGDISVSLFPKDAPITVTNFIHKGTNNYYNDLTFHRVEDWVIQGGDPLGNGTGGGPMKTEANSRSFVTGSLGIAASTDQNGAIISNDSQFFIVKKDATWLDNKYTNFGIVTSGMDVVNSMQIGDKILGVTVSKSNQ